MDVFQHRYYRLNKTMMTLIGQWPYQRTRARLALSAVIIFVGTCDILSRILAVLKYRDDSRILMDCTLPILLDAFFATKFIGFISNSQNTLKLLNRIRIDWQMWAQDQEIGILHAYTKKGTQITIIYTAVMFSSSFIVMVEPVVPKIIDVLLRNGTEPGRFPFPAVYYRLDEQKYYFYIIVYGYVSSSMLLLVILTNGVMLISYVHHGSGIFAALGILYYLTETFRRKLERIGYDDISVETGKNPYSRHEREMLHIASCINRHNDAIEYVNLIDAVYIWTFFVTIGLGTILINVTGLEILRRKSNPEDFSRFIILACCVLLNIYGDCYFAQILMDRSIAIHFSIYNNQWYKVSVKAQRLLQFMLMRSKVPCELTAGKMFVMSMSSYRMIVRSMISFLTFTRSLTRI